MPPPVPIDRPSGSAARDRHNDVPPFRTVSRCVRGGTAQSRPDTHSDQSHSKMQRRPIGTHFNAAKTYPVGTVDIPEPPSRSRPYSHAASQRKRRSARSRAPRLFNRTELQLCDPASRVTGSANQLGLESSSPPLATTATTATRATTPRSGRRNGVPARSLLRFVAEPMRAGEPTAPTDLTLSKLTACGRAGAAYAAPARAWLAIAAPRIIFLNILSTPLTTRLRLTSSYPSASR